MKAQNKHHVSVFKLYVYSFGFQTGGVAYPWAFTVVIIMQVITSSWCFCIKTKKKIHVTILSYCQLATLHDLIEEAHIWPLLCSSPTAYCLLCLVFDNLLIETSDPAFGHSRPFLYFKSFPVMNTGFETILHAGIIIMFISCAKTKIIIICVLLITYWLSDNRCVTSFFMLWCFQVGCRENCKE